MGMHTKFLRNNNMLVECRWPHEAYAVQKFIESHPDLPDYIIFRNIDRAKKWEEDELPIKTYPSDGGIVCASISNHG